ncbi:hypothetical protein CC1G_12674 [Coprinopsis cinerea okayama7|uniref:Uncharacterized protein n=1 Tax=Coprinopsis cinerea (strain Okayama-7 / 130 / ATCC MYA-4618 / FGSC 9003) TaxID=240176 RepID=A8PHM1_COPC7|nr:hypothetical protein CC1G_12674 [Coprinopsis cinerea okayama7\|eukprot:XP_001841434.2 hypothetical protein CC1G_12674 [Coprinopsis cinerea okayama7\
MEGVIETGKDGQDEWGGGSTEEVPGNPRVGVPKEQGAPMDNRGTIPGAGTGADRAKDLAGGRTTAGYMEGKIGGATAENQGDAAADNADDNADSEVRIVGHILPSGTQPQDGEPRAGEPADQPRSFAGMTFELDSDDDDDVSTGSSYGASGAIDEPAISSTHFERHMRSLKWMYAQLQLRENNYIRLRNLLMRDLALVEAAIWNREEEDERRERSMG